MVTHLGSETDTVYFCPAKLTGARIYAVFCDAETVPFDNRFFALGTVGMFGIEAGNITRVYVPKSCF